jgi:proline iminopeptidase
MKEVFIGIVCILCCHLSVCQTLRAHEGFVKVEGGKIWYKIVGEGKGIPLLLIHGGPGARSCSGIPQYSLLANERPVIFYDQLGSGMSDIPTDTALWKLSRFVDEIDSLRKHLGLKQLHILGHSWGGAVLIEYLLTKKPGGIRSAIFAGPLLSTSLWIKDAKKLLALLPQPIQDTISKYESERDYQAPAYLAATDSFYARFLSVKQWPMAVNAECEKGLSGNLQVYNYMWGPTEFTATGTLINFDRTNRLKELKQPVLFIGGRYDEARPATMKHFHQMVPQSKLIIIENAGHNTAVDQPVKFTNALRKFMFSVER